eukprot:2668649-Prymnesium_polylepis.1
MAAAAAGGAARASRETMDGARVVVTLAVDSRSAVDTIPRASGGLHRQRRGRTRQAGPSGR